MNDSLRWRYTRETLNVLDRYPAWPINQKLELGKIGFYFNRYADFRWVRSLNGLGIEPKSITAAVATEDLYTSEGAVDFNFSVTAGGLGKASFSFSRKDSIATQGYNLFHSYIDLEDLSKKLFPLITTGKIDWDEDWLLLTEIWTGDSYTAMMSKDRGGKIDISTNVPIKAGGGFNIADVNLGVSATNGKKMSMQSVGKKSDNGGKITPLFHCLKIVNVPGKGLSFRRYGEDDGWFS